MVIAMLLISPQQQLLGSLEGTNLFLRSIAGEPGAWYVSHVAMLFAALIFLGFAKMKLESSGLNSAAE